MPKPGWKSITVTDDVYNYFHDEYLKRKKQRRLQEGVTSFSGYITKRLYELMQQEKQRNQKQTSS